MKSSISEIPSCFFRANRLAKIDLRGHFQYSTMKDKKRGTEFNSMIIHVQSSSNNTILTLTGADGKVKAWNSAGTAGFRGARRSTNYAAQQAAEILAQKTKDLGFTTVAVKLKGMGAGRETAVRGLKIGGLRITRIDDCTPIAHNGCRTAKKRRF